MAAAPTPHSVINALEPSSAELSFAVTVDDNSQASHPPTDIDRVHQLAFENVDISEGGTESD